MPSPVPTPSRPAALLRYLGVVVILGIVMAGFLTPTIAIGSVISADGLNIAKSLPAYMQNIQLQSVSTLYGKKGGTYAPFATFYDENRIPVTYNQISSKMRHALISIEDPRFYHHGGVDLQSTLRALVQNQVSGSIQSGSSTITMQLVRTQLIEAAVWSNDQKAINAARNDTLSRKIREMRLAIGMEQQYSKSQILTEYLNSVNYGGTVYGIEAASRYYFGKSAKDLTLPEAALLAGMGPAPNAYRPDVAANLQRTTARRNLVLERMQLHGYISKKEMNEAIKTPVVTHITPQRQGCAAASDNAQYFCDYVVSVIRSDESFGKTSDERLALLRRGGLNIYTSIDLDLQNSVQGEMDNAVPRDSKFGAATTIVKVGTGEILAMAQNRNYDPTNQDATNVANTAINYNTDQSNGGSTGFQGGSTYKAFTLIDWLKNGHSLNDNLNAPAPVTLSAKSFPDRCHAGGWAGVWNLDNAETMRSSFNVAYATQWSINTGFAAMAQKLDLCDIRDTAAAFGVHRADGKELQHNPTSVIGTNEVSPLTMAAAYAGIGNSGTYCKPTAIDRIVDSQTGAERAVPSSSCTRAADANVDRTALQALEGVFTGGTAKTANPNDGTQIAGKTGSTDNYWQTWLVSTTSQVAQATWVGNPQAGNRTDLRTVHINGVQGLNVRLTYGRQIQALLDRSYPATPFPNPGDTVQSSTTIPDVSGKPVDEAQTTLRAAGYNPVIGSTVASNKSRGTVAYTSPAAGSSAAGAATVTLFISDGSGKLTVPDVTGVEVSSAVALLKQIGFTNIRRADGGDLGATDVVNSVNPAVGSAVEPGAQITLDTQ